MLKSHLPIGRTIAVMLSLGCSNFAVSDEPSNSAAYPQWYRVTPSKTKRYCPPPNCPPCPSPAVPADPGAAPLLSDTLGQQNPVADPNMFATAPQAGTVGSRSFAPNMIGDFYGGATNSESFVIISRAAIVANGDFTGIPINALPATDGLLGIPANIYTTHTASTQQVFNNSGGFFLSNSSLQGTTTADSTVTTGVSGLNMKALSNAAFAGGQPEYLAPVAAPPGSYGSDANTIFVAVTGNPNGTTVYDPNASGIITQTVDPLDPDMGDDWAAFYYYNYGYRINIPSPSAGGVVGRMKIAENTSPLPRDRVFFNYSYFNGVPLVANGVDINRFTPGFEKTFFNGQASFELRTPFASTLSNNVYSDGVTNSNSTQFGNLTMYLKQLFYTSDTVAVSGGLGIALPTASNVNVRTVAGQELVRIKNESVHLLPFLGSLYTPTDRLFFQQFLQFDFDTNGNPVAIADQNGGLVNAGRANDSTFLYYSLSAGYWLYNNPDGDRLFTRIAPMAEIHYNRSLQGTDVVAANGFQVGSYSDNIELLNGTLGMTAMMGANKTLTAAYVTPLGGGVDQQFNGEFRLMFNWFFGGPTNRFSRVQF